jgi:hypothetical protein
MHALVKMLEAQLTESDSSQHEVGEQRERNHRYVTLQPLGNEQRGRSHYISPDVLDAVQAKKALFSETFFSDRQTVMFNQTTAGVPGEADAKTAYVNKVFRQNNHYRLFRDGWHDAFVAKRMVVLVCWCKSTREIEVDVEQTMPEQLPAVVEQTLQGKRPLSIDTSELQLDQVMTPQGPLALLTGTVRIEVDDSYPKMELCVPERYHRDPMADYPCRAQWNTYEEEVARGTLIEDGYDPEQVNRLTNDYRFRSNEEDFSRKAHDASWSQRRQTNREKNQETITRYRTWTYIDLDKVEESGEDLELSFDRAKYPGANLFEVHWSRGEILKREDGTHWIEPAEEMPFFEWTEIKISHAEHGMCTADLSAHTQKVQSVLKRLIVDNNQQRNNPRTEAKLNAIKNPRDLLENGIGTTLWVRETGAVNPLNVPDLSPMTMSVIQMLAQDGERRDGYSSLGRGTNNDAVRYQNADSMIERLTTAGTRRPMSAARDWANTFLVPLSQYICRLAMRHDESVEQQEIRGRFIVVAPQQWRDYDCEMTVATALTPQERQEHAASMLTMHTVMKDDPDLAAMYGAPQKHALIDSIFEALGVSDSTPYLMRPDSPEYMQKQMEANQQQQQVQALQMQAAGMQLQLAQSQDRREWEKLRWDQTTEMDRATREIEELDHKKFVGQEQVALGWSEHYHKMEVDAAEIEIERTQRRQADVG